MTDKIKEGTVDYPEKWSSISTEAKDLIKNLLKKDPKTRFSPLQALAHKWTINSGKRGSELKKNARSIAQRLNKSSSLDIYDNEYFQAQCGSILLEQKNSHKSEESNQAIAKTFADFDSFNERISECDEF